MTETAPDAKAKRFQCSECGAQMTFDAATGQLACAHCGAKQAVPDAGGRVVERDLFAGFAEAGRGFGAEVKVHRCQECGANVSFSAGTTATRCSFCGSSKVLDQTENAQTIRPGSLIPFSIDNRVANAAFARWLGKLWFRPSDLKQLAAVQEVHGIYVPFWTYDATVDSQWRAERGIYYYIDETYSAVENGQEVTKTRRSQQTRWEPAWGRRHDDYDDQLVCASQGLPDDLAAKLETFDMQRLVPYAPGYLAGFRAEEYAIDLRAGWEQARARIEREQQQRCGKDVGGDTQRGLSVDNEYSALTYKHVLLPVWLAAYRYQGKVFRFLVNGQTGEVVGKAPWSAPKIIAFILFLAALVGAIVFIIMMSQSQ